MIQLHLNTTNCKCGYEFTKQDIKPPLMGQAAAIGKTQKNFYGGNVDKFSVADCPECGLKYNLWLKQIGQTWKVVTISASGWDPNTISEESAKLVGDGITDEIDVIQTLLGSDEGESYPSATYIVQEQNFATKGDSFDDMDKQALQEWLDEREIKYHTQLGEKKLRDECRAVVIKLAKKESDL